ncbi:hypothetical protein LEP1GSC170_1242 [Leptospira interrogans serovar Bataviae str. HAI135]|nr:hypothetical protein LEP1GSC170_1242 [Leptospira interrogans serovar Bataviae str. HAI135]
MGVEIVRTSRRKKIPKQKNRTDLICNKVLTDYPDWRAIAKMALSQRGKAVPDWPEYVFTPLSSYIPILFPSGVDLNDPYLLKKMTIVSQLAAIVPWSLSKAVYKFSNELSQELNDSLAPEKLPTEIIKRLPQWSIYVETPEDYIEGCNGFFAHLEFDRGSDELRILLDYHNEPPCPLTLIIGDYTLEESFEIFAKNLKNNMHIDNVDETLTDFIKTPHLNLMTKILPLILYICSENSEITGPYPHSKYIQKMRYKKISNLVKLPTLLYGMLAKS